MQAQTDPYSSHDHYKQTNAQRTVDEKHSSRTRPQRSYLFIAERLVISLYNEAD